MSTELEKLLEQQARIKARISKARARARTQQRKDDTSRKVIAGALALEHAAKNPDSEFARIMCRLIDEYTPENRRHLFNLDAANDTAADTSEAPLRSIFERMFKEAREK